MLTYPDGAEGLATPCIQILREAYGRLNISIRIVPLPGVRGMTDSNMGVIDGQVARFTEIEGEAPNLIRVPTKIAEVEVVPVVLKVSGRQTKSWEVLKPHSTRIGVRHGAYLPPGLVAEERVQRPITYSSMFEMLALGRLDVVLVPRGISESAIKLLSANLKEQQPVFVELPTIAKAPMYHYVHKKNAALVAKLDIELKKMTKAGTIDHVWNSLGK